MTLNDSSDELGDDYIFHRDGKWTKIYGKSVYLDTDIYSNILKHNFNDQFIIAQQNPDREHHKLFIRSNYQTRFSIYDYYLEDSIATFSKSTPETVEAIKRDKQLYELLNSKGVTRANSIKDWEIIDSVLDSVFISDPFYVKLFSSSENYWIIDKETDKRFGPLTEEEFNRKSSELGLSLKFKD